MPHIFMLDSSAVERYVGAGKMRSRGMKYVV